MSLSLFQVQTTPVQACDLVPVFPDMERNLRSVKTLFWSGVNINEIFHAV